MHKLTVANNGETYQAEPGETMLDTLLRSGVRVRYGCRRGKCSSCKHLVVDGSYDNSEASAYALLYEEREEGLTLLCQTYPSSDCTVELMVEAGDEDGVKLATPGTVSGRVTASQELPDGLVEVRLELEDALRFLPGQYVEVAPTGRPEASRTYALASPPMWVRRPSLVVRRRSDGTAGGLLDTDVDLQISGPYGRLYLRPSGRPALLIGHGEGIAPLLSMARYVAVQGWSVPIHLLHACERSAELAFTTELTALATRDPNFRYTGVMEDIGAPGKPPIRNLTGALNASLDPGADVDVYVAGPPAFCDRVAFVLEARGIDESRIFLERFFQANAEGQ